MDMKSMPPHEIAWRLARRKRMALAAVRKYRATKRGRKKYNAYQKKFQRQKRANIKKAIEILRLQGHEEEVIKVAIKQILSKRGMLKEMVNQA